MPLSDPISICILYDNLPLGVEYVSSPGNLGLSVAWLASCVSPVAAAITTEARVGGKSLSL
jgi:hypothetical protein